MVSRFRLVSILHHAFHIQIHDAALLHHRVGRYNSILRCLVSAMRARRSVGASFRAWVLRSRTMIAAKSRYCSQTLRRRAKIFTSWRALALWRVHIIAALELALSGKLSELYVDGSADMKSKASSLSASAVCVMISHPVSWPNVSIIRRGIDHLRLFLPSLSGNIGLNTSTCSSILKQTLKCLFQKIRTACLVSTMFHSWNRCAVRVVNHRLKAIASIFDGSVNGIMSGVCVTLGRAHPLLLGYCAFKVG